MVSFQFLANFEPIMRIVVVLKYLCLLLWGGAPTMEASLPTPAAHYYAKDQVADSHGAAFSNKDQLTIVIEDNESDNEEELHGGNDLKNKNNLSFGTSSTPYYYANKVLPYVTTKFDHACGKTIAPIFGNTSPIYIKNRVLRI